ncbi:ABC-ATPase domain-containing protein [Staphylothermus hellenicus]|uniref:ABC-ATPase domain-containing protein n=1 Tax=Staphylothermus hellenicus TaxID=84599 RepID=UPI000A58E6D8|nr:ABC-ATPase domain-containing protein [Staphylothermus hellenicus]
MFSSDRVYLVVDEIGVFLGRFAGRGFGYYKSLRNVVFDYDGVKAYFTRIQSDPYAPPSVFQIVVPGKIHGLKLKGYGKNDYLALSDYLYRRLYSESVKYRRKCGSGYSCFLGVPKPSPIMIYRSGAEIVGEDIVLRIFIGLPASGRRILVKPLNHILSVIIPRIINKFRNMYRCEEEIWERILYLRDYLYIQKLLEEENAVAFIANNSVLPRESSISQKPLANAVPFRVEDRFSREIRVPSGKTVYGLIIPRGLTVITGGGYHGKTTLLEALQDGIYPHIPGDGREYVVSRPRTVLVKAEDGRFIHRVDISSFIKKIPGGGDTRDFISRDASGSTSMAASINELVEVGVDNILLDEDTSATNLLYKDEYMSKLLYDDPITTITQLARSFTEKTRTNLVIVSSASSILLSKAGFIILMRNYKPTIRSRKEMGLVDKLPDKQYIPPRERRVFRGIRGVKKIRAKGSKLILKYVDGIVFELDLKNNPRIIENGQVKMIATILKWIIREKINGSTRELVETINNVFREKGFRGFTSMVPPDLGWVDGLDVAWTINRLYNVVFEKRPS